VATENNRGIDCPSGYSIFGPHEASSVRDWDSEIQKTRLEVRDQFKNQEKYIERFVIKKGVNVWTVIIKCNFNRDAQ
jgi:hypothetical protein